MKRATIGENSSGFVAIIVAVVVTVIISVITISFTRIMRREQRQALDRQLSTQAFYAAESGANYAIKSGMAERSECEQPGDPGYLDAHNAVKFTCLLVNDDPDELVFDDVNTDEPTIFRINENLSEMTIGWQSSTGNTTWPPGGWYTPTPTFRVASEWGSIVSVVEVVIWPIKSTIDSDDLLTSARTYYLYPSPGGISEEGTVNYSSDGDIVSGKCHQNKTPKHCQVKIAGMGASGATNGYVVRLRSIYSSVSLQINGTDVGGQPTELTGAQRVIDVTGRASDVLRRVQIRLPIRSSYSLPIFAIETAGDLCKRLDVYPDGADNSVCSP